MGRRFRDDAGHITYSMGEEMWKLFGGALGVDM